MAKLIEITGKPFSGEWGSDDEIGNGIPVIRTTNFTNKGIVDYANVVTRCIEKKNIEDKYLQYGDIILEKSGGSDKQPVGRVVFFEGTEHKYLFNNFTGLLRIKDKSKWLPKFVFYSLFASYLRGETRNFENKTTGLHNLKIDLYMSNIEVNDFPYTKQMDIVKKIDKINFLIELREKQIEKLDLLVKSRFIELFGDPVFNNKGWKVYKLKEVTKKIGSGATPKGGKESYPNEGISFIRSLNVHDGLFEFKDLAHLTEQQAKQLNNVAVEKEDVLINITGASVARTCVVPAEILPARVNQHVSIIRCNKDYISPIFVNRQFLNDSFKKRLLKIGEAGGATRQAITKQQLEDISVIVPTYDLQKAFAHFIQQTDKSKLAIQQSLEKLEILKKSLMQEYFG